MTAISYPDCDATSKSGRFSLEARSPHNGTIRRRDGRIASEDDYSFQYRDHQNQFRYRLLDNVPQTTPGLESPTAESPVVWERFQGDDEDSPHELVVSDDGWSIIRTHGFSPEIIAVGCDGQDRLRVRLAGVSDKHDDPDENLEADGPVWILARMAPTTAGKFWSANSWSVFFRHQDQTYFAWRAWWGQRLVLDLERSVAFTEDSPLPADLHAAVVEAERTDARAILQSLSERMDEVRDFLARRSQPVDEVDRNSLLHLITKSSSALHLAGVHQMRDCVPFLREWEGVDCPFGESISSAMPDRWWIQNQHFRPIVQHALKKLGEEPAGYPTYEFVTGFRSTERLSIPQQLADRQIRATRLNQAMTAEEVLSLLGSPDYLNKKSEKVGHRHEWTEIWEYDFRQGTGWTTLRLSWKEMKGSSRMAAIDEIAPDWLESPNEREAEFLRF